MVTVICGDKVQMLESIVLSAPAVSESVIPVASAATMVGAAAVIVFNVGGRLLLLAISRAAPVVPVQSNFPPVLVVGTILKVIGFTTAFASRDQSKLMLTCAGTIFVEGKAI